MRFRGEKRRRLFDDFISRFIPENINEFIYVEPFGGTFSVNKYLHKRPLKSIYNDYNTYDLEIDADEIYHLDYKEIFKKFDSENTIFYLDPPYYGKEELYKGGIKGDKDFHYELMNEIKKLKGKIILSYEDVSYIRYLYKDFNIHLYDGERQTFKYELIITK